ncbi:MAG TPA: hypothetical protein VH301_13495, partial [Usitatibacter sp.]|nr:hypothetical protein [Usitatibacter sp.]
YIATRNGGRLPQKLGDPDVVDAAWELLACNYGSECGENSEVVTFQCIYNAVCEDDLYSVLPRRFPSLTPARMDEALRMELTIAAQIQGRDWDRLGF